VVIVTGHVIIIVLEVHRQSPLKVKHAQ
jgi:hypothetical protein